MESDHGAFKPKGLAFSGIDIYKFLRFCSFSSGAELFIHAPIYIGALFHLAGSPRSPSRFAPNRSSASTVSVPGSVAARLIMESALAPLADINATTVLDGGGSSSDTADWVDVGVPGAELYSANENYFFYHHTHGIEYITLTSAHKITLHDFIIV